MALAYDDEPPRSKTSQRTQGRLLKLLEHDGNLAEAVDDKELVRIGAEVMRETAIDEAARKDWKELAERALKDARQQRGETKTWPWPNAADIRYPALAVAAIQFQARAYPALVRGDEVCVGKPAGADPSGEKARRGQRAASFVNDQLMYQCDEWEPGTDALLLRLPVVGSAFRKVTWNAKLQRPKLMLASALDVIVPMDCESADEAPRITQDVERYPYQVAGMVRSGAWLEHDYNPHAEDTQKPCQYYEQLRYIDMDDDGLPEPYVVTVHRESERVVRIDPAFDREDLTVSETGGIEAVSRQSPWIDYGFLPDPDGGPYGMGFGHLLADLTETVNATINQMLDAAKLANVQGGFVSGGLGLRAGKVQFSPGEWKIINAPADQMRNAFYTPDFKGPSPVTYQLLDLLLSAVKDITAVKDVLTGEAPSQQPAASTLALIEQGLSVFTGIHKRVYRSLRREYRAVWKLNQRYLPPEKYAEFIDWQAPEPMAPPQGAQPGMAPMQQAPMEPPTPEKDFDLTDMDVRPVADPQSATSMQRLAKAQAEMQLGQGDPAIDQSELKRRAFQALGTADIDKLFVQGTPPAVGMQMAKIAADEQKAERELAIKERAQALDEAKFEWEQQKHADEMAVRGIERRLDDERADAEAQSGADESERARMADLAKHDSKMNGAGNGNG